VAWHCWRAAEHYGGAAESALTAKSRPTDCASRRLSNQGERWHRGGIEPLPVIHEGDHRPGFDISGKEIL
jgi:hypothetical protein